MRYDFVYENNNGEKINLSKLPYKINIEPLIDYSWSYKTKQRQLGNKIVGFFKDIKDSTATLHVLAATAKERDEAIDYFNNVIEKDIYYGTAGKLWLGDWYTYAFITASKNSKWQYDAGIVKKEITISKEADSWYHITRSANYGEQEESTVYIAEDYIKTYEGRDAGSDIKSLTANIVPQQSGSGTPSPENVREISGWESVIVNATGKNLLSTPYNDGSKTNNGITWTVNDDGTVTANGTATGDSYFYFRYNDDYLPYSSYHVSGCPSGGSTNTYYLDVASWAGYNQVKDVGDGITFNHANLDARINNKIRIIAFIKSGTTANNLVFKPMITKGACGYDDYTPYIAPTTHNTSLGRTVYGGEVDVVSGVLTVTGVYLKLNTSKLGGSDSWPTWVGCGVRELVGGGLNSIIRGALSSITGTVYANTANTNDLLFLSGSEVGKTKAELIAMAIDVDFFIPLAEPQTYTLTPSTINTLAGVNNVWADSGNVTVTFRDDHGDIQTESGSIVTFEKKNALSGSGYDYAYDYMHDAQSQKIIANAGSIPCDFIITIQGYADSPIITIGDNTYAVNVEVPYGANLVIDSTQKTVIITLADGTKINAFGARDPDYYLFERIESGKNAVTWDGSYLWELLMIEERSEPRWLTD